MRVLTYLLLIMVYQNVKAQKLSDTLTTGSTLLRFNIINLVDVSEPNISFGAERRISGRLSLALDAGYIVHSQRFHDIGRSSGFIIRPAVRYFPEKSRIFLEAEVHYKQHTHHIHDWIGRDVVAGVPAYQEYKEFRLRKQVIGPHFKFGTLIPVNNRFWFEFYVGVGIHFRKYSVVGEKNVVYTFNQDLQTVTTGDSKTLVAVPVGWRILYRLR
jgi:hypothetical protein